MIAEKIETGTSGAGLRWARWKHWRLVAYQEGGYCLQRRNRQFGWLLLGPDDDFPRQVEEALCLALGIECSH